MREVIKVGEDVQTETKFLRQNVGEHQNEVYAFIPGRLANITLVCKSPEVAEAIKHLLNECVIEIRHNL